MSLSNNTIIDVRFGGSDTLCGGTFWPSVTLAFDAGITITNPTSASPTVSSTSYTFVAGDVGTWWLLQSASNGFPGWYQITAVNTGVATLNAAIGAGYVFSNNAPASPTATQGIGSGTLSSVRWCIDYSQQNAAQFAPTTFSSPSSSAGATMNWTGATLAMIGNGVFIPTITNATSGYYQIVSAVAGTSITLDRNWNTAQVNSGAGTVYIGGALASIGQAGSIWTSWVCFINYNASKYLVTSATGNVSGGCLGTGGQQGVVIGWATNRCLANTDANQPYIQASGIANFTLMNFNLLSLLYNVILDANSLTSGVCCNKFAIVSKCIVKNQTAAGSASTLYHNCQITGFTAAVASNFLGCEIFSNNVAAGCVAPQVFMHKCLVYNNTGIGVNYTTTSCTVTNTVAYNNTLAGFSASGGNNRLLINCVSVNNGGAGFTVGNSGPQGDIFLNCAAYNNTSGNTLPANTQGFITLTGNPFVNAGSGNFALNGTAGAGALLKAAGFPALFPAGVTADFSDLNAVQSQNTIPLTSIINIGTPVGRGSFI